MKPPAKKAHSERVRPKLLPDGSLEVTHENGAKIIVPREIFQRWMRTKLREAT